MIYVKIGENLYPATVDGHMTDYEWDNRDSKTIKLDRDFQTVDALFPDGTTWSIVQEEQVEVPNEPIVDENGQPVLDENGQPTYKETEGPTYKTVQTEYDNSEYFVRGDLTVHTDGTCSVKMGKPTDLENAYEMIYGGAEL